MNEMVNDDFYELLEVWLRTFVVDHASPYTIVAYRNDVAVFLNYCNQLNLSIKDVAASDLRSYIAYCHERLGLTNKTIERYLTSIRGFMKWLTRNGHLAANTSIDIKVKKDGQQLPIILSPEQLNQLLDQPSPILELEIWLWKRDKSMMEILYSSGLRASELINLKLQDIDYSSCLVRVISGKGNKDRVVPIGGKAIEATKDWLSYRSMKTPDHNYLFINHLGGHLTVRQLRRRINTQALRAGLSEHLHPHLFRHCFATHMLTESQNIRAVQEMLGHADISSTEIYTKLDFATLAKTYDNAHPRAKKIK